MLLLAPSKNEKAQQEDKRRLRHRISKKRFQPLPTGKWLSWSSASGGLRLTLVRSLHWAAAPSCYGVKAKTPVFFSQYIAPSSLSFLLSSLILPTFKFQIQMKKLEYVTPKQATLAKKYFDWRHLRSRYKKSSMPSPYLPKAGHMFSKESLLSFAPGRITVS